MERYGVLNKVGEGSFGCVYRAVDNETGNLVAIKWLKGASDTSYSEVRALTLLDHSNIVKLNNVLHEPNDAVYLVFEYMECSLHQFIYNMRMRRQLFSEAEIRSLIYQVLQGLAFMHKKGFMHRDMKPGNLLMNQGTIKIADLGSATEIDSATPFQEYVTTRWYRAPEMLFRTFIWDKKLRPFFYDEKVDMWAMGAIMAELFLMRPLFPGINSVDQLYKICRVIGSPTSSTWKEGKLLASQLNLMFLPLNGVGLRAMMPYASDSAIDLIGSLCSWDPLRRPTASEALQHPFFKRTQNVQITPGFSSCIRRPIRNQGPTLMTMQQQQPILVYLEPN